MSDERKAIEETIKTYFDGLYEGDTGKLATAFHPTSALTWEHEGGVRVLPREQWLAAIGSRSSPQSQGLERGDEIVSIDQCSPTTAFVKVKCQIPPRYFTDYLNLLKVDGRWQVVQKIYAAETRAADAKGAA